jgi:kanamycin kinase
VKWAPVESGIDLMAEVARLIWASRFVCVPRVLEHGTDEHGAWFVSTPIHGESAVSDRWKAEPARAVAAIGYGLRVLHEALPVNDCPFSWEATARVADARALALGGKLDRAQWNVEHPRLSLEEALKAAADPPPVDRLVVCHGDACSPNTLLTADGQVAGHVDLGSLGVADRWADLAIATWSTEWNYGRGWEELVLESYGIGPDRERTAYYRLLWDLGP